MCKAINYIDEINKLFSNINSDIERIKEEQQEIDYQETDIRHFIENENFNASRGYSLAKQLKEVRNKRRDLKNEIDVLNTLKNQFIDVNKNEIKNITNLIRSKWGNHIKQKDDKMYNPRSKKYAIHIPITQVETKTNNIQKLRNVNKTNIKFGNNKQIENLNNLFNQIESERVDKNVG
jgi:hypothetical protein